MNRNDPWGGDIDTLLATKLDYPKQELNTLTLGQLLDKAANSVPDKIGYVIGEQRINFGRLNQVSDALASALCDLGFQKGDRVAIYMKNSLELVEAFYALQKLGVIVTWINPQYRKVECEYILRDSGAKGIFIFDEWQGYDYLGSILSMRSDLPELKFVIVVGEGEGKDVYRFDDLLNSGLGKGYSKENIDTRNDLSMLIYTSGSTGDPKGAMITHYSAVRAGFVYSLVVDATSEDIIIGFLPMCHSYGCGVLLIQPVLLKMTTVLMEEFRTENVFQVIEKERVTIQPAAPAHYLLQLNHPNRRDYDLSSLRGCLTGGQILPEGLVSRVQEEMDVYLSNMWGASEVGPGLGLICPYPTPLELREIYVGIPVPGTRIKVVDPATGKELAIGKVGELAVSGWHVMKGYWNKPEETTRQVVDGWFYTGDLVAVGENGFVKVHGRTKDLINRGGYKIYPSELEGLILEHPKVAQVCIVPTPNPVLGENVCACIIPKGEQKITLSEIRDFLKDKVAPQKLPDELCIFKEFPKLPGGVKIKKFGKGGLVELASKYETRERYRK